MSKWEKLIISVGRLLPALALMLGTATATRACNWWFHQPKVPEALKGDKRNVI